MIDLQAGGDDDGRRLDRILRKALPDLPLSGIHRLLRKGRVLVEGKPAPGDRRVRGGERICILDGTGPAAVPESPSIGLGLPSAWILEETGGLLIINKPAGIAVHGRDSLDSRVQVYLKGRLPPSLSFKPGPLHRLDKPASGVIVFSKSLEGARIFSALMRERRLKKTYLALAEGSMTEPAWWEDSLIRDRNLQKTFASAESGARIGQTGVFPLVSSAGDGNAPVYTLIKLEIHTGLTHQIRAQAALHGHPLAGDWKYGGKALPGGPFLHAYSLEFPPDNGPPGLEGSRITAPLPENFKGRIARLFRDAHI